jgi:hypothetical protein
MHFVHTPYELLTFDIDQYVQTCTQADNCKYDQVRTLFIIGHGHTWYVLCTYEYVRVHPGCQVSRFHASASLAGSLASDHHDDSDGGNFKLNSGLETVTVAKLDPETTVTVTGPWRPGGLQVHVPSLFGQPPAWPGHGQAGPPAVRQARAPVPRQLQCCENLRLEHDYITLQPVSLTRSLIHYHLTGRLESPPTWMKTNVLVHTQTIHTLTNRPDFAYGQARLYQ